jgi:hypothetical protein
MALIILGMPLQWELRVAGYVLQLQAKGRFEAEFTFGVQTSLTTQLLVHFR